MTSIAMKGLLEQAFQMLEADCTTTDLEAWLKDEMEEWHDTF